MTQTNEKAGRGCHPIRPDNSLHDTKTISSNRRGINGKRDLVSEKYRRLKMTAGQRFNELARLVAYRRRYGLDLGSATGWALVLSNLTECLGVTADCYAVDQIRRRLRLPAIDFDVIAACCSPAEGRLMPQQTVGELLEVSSCERQDCRLLRIEACDEPQADRKRRLARERQQRRRHVTRTIRRKDCGRDTRRRAAWPALRALHSSSAVGLPARQEPQPLSFPVGEKAVRDAPRQASETCRALAPQARFADPSAPICQSFHLMSSSSESRRTAPPQGRSRVSVSNEGKISGLTELSSRASYRRSNRGPPK